MGFGTKIIIGLVVVILLWKAPDLIVNVFNGIIHGLGKIGSGVG